MGGTGDVTTKNCCPIIFTVRGKTYSRDAAHSKATRPTMKSAEVKDYRLRACFATFLFVLLSRDCFVNFISAVEHEISLLKC